MLSILTSLLASASLVSADLNKVTLSVESKNATLDGKFLTALHEGAGISSIFLTSSPQQYIYNSTSDTVSYDVMLAGQYYMTLAEFGQGLAATVTGPPYALLKDDYLSINGSSSVFYACSSLAFDPYGYAKSNIGVGVYGSDEKAPDGCQAIKIKGELGDSVSTGSSSATAAAVVASTEAASSEEATESSESSESSTEEASTTAAVTSSSSEASSTVETSPSSVTSAAANSTSGESTSSTSTHANSTSSHTSTRSSSVHSSSSHAQDGAISAGIGGGLIAGIAYFLL